LCGELSDYKVKVSKKGKDYAPAKIHDVNDSIEITFFDRVISKKSDILVDGAVLVVFGRISGNSADQKGRVSVAVDDVIELDSKLSEAFPTLTVETSLEDLEPVLNYFVTKTEPTDSPNRKLSRVILSIFDGQGRAFYSLNDSVELNLEFLTETSNSLGRLNTIKCDITYDPYY
jgi:DNA polymerase III alpha subunit